MIKRIFQIAVFAIAIINTFSANAEKIRKERYGKVSMEELTMTTYEKDTSAGAIILYSLGTFDPNTFRFSLFLRAKILRQSGTNQANMMFYGKLKQNIKGCTYNLENGQIVKTKLKNESIFEERMINNVYYTRIALPNVKVGSVFEVEFTFDGVPYFYDFQRNIPVVYAALDFAQNAYITMKTRKDGLLGFSYHEGDIWIAKDIPAFKKEPYMLSENDDRLRFEFEPVSINFPGYIKNFCTSWNMATSWYLDNIDLGGLLEDLNFCLGELADSVKGRPASDEEKLRYAFDLVKRRVKWNNQDACYGSQPFKKTLEIKSGNSADINLLLVALLRKSGITADPILFSTRSNGKIFNSSPTIRKFNYVIAGVKIDGKIYYLDASQEYLPFGLTPEKLLGCIGHEISENSFTPPCSVVLNPIQKDKFTTLTNLQIDTSGSAKGKITIVRTDYNAIKFKDTLKTFTDHDAYVEKLESSYTNVHINSFECSDVEKLDEPLKEEMNISLSNSSSNNGVIVINSNFFPEIGENPFVSEKRTTPVVFPEPIEYTTVTNISLPPNYQVLEAPKSILVSSPDKTLNLSYKVFYDKSAISIRMRFTLDKLTFDLSEYGILRQVFEMLVQKQSESIILKKI